MLSPELLTAFVSACVLLSISPGPSNLYIMARALAQGPGAGFIAAAGLALGAAIHVIAAVLGLSVIFLYSPTLYTVVKLIGAVYLIYLGVGYWWQGSGALTVEKLKPKSISKIFSESVVVELTNPKTALFYIAILPQFVSVELGNTQLQLLLLGLISIVIAVLFDSIVALFSGKFSSWLANSHQAQRIQNRVSGMVLVGLGAFIAVEEAR